jgi:hypothetical protein
MGGCGLNACGSGQGLVVGCCERGEIAALTIATGILVFHPLHHCSYTGIFVATTVLATYCSLKC